MDEIRIAFSQSTPDGHCRARIDSGAHIEQFFHVKGIACGIANAGIAKAGGDGDQIYVSGVM